MGGARRKGGGSPGLHGASAEEGWGHPCGAPGGKAPKEFNAGKATALRCQKPCIADARHPEALAIVTGWPRPQGSVSEANRARAKGNAKDPQHKILRNDDARCRQCLGRMNEHENLIGLGEGFADTLVLVAVAIRENQCLFA